MENIELKRRLSFSPDDSIEVTVAPNAGACFGVVRAIKLGNAALEKKERGQVYSFGPLIHNPSVVNDLENRGLQIVSDPQTIEQGTVVLRSHGVQKEIEKNMKDRGVQIVDATCPLVKKPQRIAQSLAQKGYFLILVGDAKHPEVKGVVSYFGSDRHLVTYHPDDIEKIPTAETRVGIIAQTTIEVKVLNAIVEKARARFSEVAVHNTICDATSVRQTEAVALASSADVIVVVGGKNSSNTCKLVKICRDLQSDTYHIEETKEIEPSWFQGKKKIGVTGGASTPHEFIDVVANHVINIVQQLNFPDRSAEVAGTHSKTVPATH